HRVEFNTLTVVNDVNAQQPMRVYTFLKDIGATYMQFIPLVERQPARVHVTVNGRLTHLAAPLEPGETRRTAVTRWSVKPRDYGAFMSVIFDRWVRHDVGRVFVQLFDSTLANWARVPGSVCIH